MTPNKCVTIFFSPPPFLPFNTPLCDTSKIEYKRHMGFAVGGREGSERRNIVNNSTGFGSHENDMHNEKWKCGQEKKKKD
jgi:hypothetical protein